MVRVQCAGLESYNHGQRLQLVAQAVILAAHMFADTAGCLHLNVVST